MKNMSGPLEYWSFSTNNEQTVGGGLMKRQQPHQTITNYFDVSLLDENAKKAEGLGSRIKVPKKKIPRTAGLS
jgi:predicted enzyme related to lactoylglutathione lyase